MRTFVFRDWRSGEVGRSCGRVRGPEAVLFGASVSSKSQDLSNQAIFVPLEFLSRGEVLRVWPKMPPSNFPLEFSAMS